METILKFVCIIILIATQACAPHSHDICLNSKYDIDAIAKDWRNQVKANHSQPNIYERHI